jgi:hypothetical protein
VHKPTRLASASFNEQRLTVETHPTLPRPRSLDTHPVAPLPTVTTPAQFDATVATAMRVLSSAVVELAAMRAAGKL